ncbi:Hypothetical protein FKW44_025334, partial [Caligus rogercresseyi]
KVQIHLLVDLHPSSTKNTGVFFPSDVTPTHTMKRGWLLPLKVVLDSTGMPSVFQAKTQSF